MADHRTDAELVTAISRDPAAFTEFYRRNVRMVLGFMVRHSHDPEQAADLTAEVFATVLLKADRFRPDRGGARTWLLSIAHHKQIDAWRRNAVETAARRRLGLRHVEAYEDDLVRIEAMGNELEAWVLELPAEQRDAVEGRIVHELPYDELASRAGVSSAAVRQRVARGLAALRARSEHR